MRFIECYIYVRPFCPSSILNVLHSHGRTTRCLHKEKEKYINVTCSNLPVQFSDYMTLS